MHLGDRFTSANWLAKEGMETDFVAAWTEFTRWAKETGGGNNFFLFRDATDPRRFVSIGGWDDADSVDEWRSMHSFADKLGRCRELCDEFEPKDYDLAAEVV